MFKKLSTIAATTILVGALAAPAMAAPATPAQHGTDPVAGRMVGVSVHDNVLDIGTSQSVSFTWDGGYSITSGQPWGGVSTGSGVSGGGSGLNIDVEAGRKGSPQVAQWFTSRTSTMISSAEWGADSFPRELNFAFTGTLTINGTEYPVVIGQGHSGTDNNWWIGGQGSGWGLSVFGQSVATDTAVLVTPDGEYTILAEAAMVNQIGVGLTSDLDEPIRY